MRLPPRLLLPALCALTIPCTRAAPQTVEGMRQALQEFALSPKWNARVQQYLDQLDAPRYEDRRKALAHLMEEPVLPLDKLEAAKRDATPDKRILIDHVTAAYDPTVNSGMLVRLFDTIAGQELKGLAPEILKALEGRRTPSPALHASARLAFAVTLAEHDQRIIQEALKSKTFVVRELGLRGLYRLKPPDTTKRATTLLHDDEASIRFLAANIVAEAGHRACLITFAELLQSKEFTFRSESHEALQTITNQDFGYYPDAVPEERQRPTEWWQRWVKKFGETAPMRFEEFIPTEDLKPIDTDLLTE